MEQTLEKYSVSEAKENLSGLLAEVEKSGQSFVISRYGRPVAIVSSFKAENKVEPKLKGVLSAFANQSFITQEKSAWKRQACKK